MAENIIEIWKANWRGNLRCHALGALILCAVTPFLFDTRGLDAVSTAKILECYLILMGIVCLVPVFLPDQDHAIRELLDTKRMSPAVVCAVRLAQSITVLTILTGGMLWYLRENGCEFPFKMYFAGSMAGMLFVGSIGMIVFALTDKMPLSYMAAILYYVIDTGGGKKYLGNWYLHSMCEESFQEKWYLFLTGAALIGLALLCRTYAGRWHFGKRKKPSQSFRIRAGMGG